MTENLLTAQQLNNALRTGDLFNTYNDMAALRAWAHVNCYDAAVAAIVNKKSSLFNTPLFSQWVDRLTVVNNHLIVPEKPVKSRQDATLLDYLVLEERILAKYIHQVNSTSQFMGVQTPHAKILDKLVSGVVCSHTTLSLFFAQFNTYRDGDRLLTAYFAQPAATRQRDGDWLNEFAAETVKRPTGLRHFVLGALFSGVAVAGIFLYPNFTSEERSLLLMVVVLICSVIEADHQKKVFAFNNAKPDVSDYMYERFKREYRAKVVSWDQIINPCPQNFECKFLLRAYFNMMHYDSLLDLNSIRDSRRMDFTGMDPQYFASLVIDCTFKEMIVDSTRPYARVFEDAMFK